MFFFLVLEGEVHTLLYTSVCVCVYIFNLKHLGCRFKTTKHKTYILSKKTRLNTQVKKK